MKKFAIETVPESEHFTAVFDRIADMAAKLTRAPVSLVTIRDKRKFFVIGSHGAYLKAFEASWPTGVELMPQKTMSFVRNVHLEPALAGHPLMKAVPYIKSLAHIPVRGQKAEIEATISIVNPKMRWPFTADATALLGDLAALIAEVLASAHECMTVHNKPGVRTPQTGFQDDFANARSGRPPAQAAVDFSGLGDTTGQFLVATMKKRTSIRNRKDVAYVTLRTWVSGIKAYQLQALNIAKARPDPIFVAHVADEIVLHAQKLLGAVKFDCVVPVPCGHSGERCLSLMIAERVAKGLGVPCVLALESTPRKGSSHPAKNAALPRPRLSATKPYGAVLLIDDVASSGRHIELSVQELRKVTPQVMAMAWIGAN